MRSNEVAKLAGVSVRTLRHYHSLGLLPEPPRSDNGYRDYTAADVARVLRIKRLASLGFPLARIGAVLEEMDAPKADPNTGSTTTGTAPGVDTLTDASPADRTALIVAGHLYDDDELGELERVIECIAGENLVQALEQLDERLGALAPDAPELERAALVDESLETLAPVIACFDTANWLRPSPDRERFLDEIAFEGNNPAQQDVYGRIGQGIEAIMAERVRAERAGGTTEAGSAAPRSA